jgi:putative SOS response-associated peptidase YedK
VCGRYGRRSDKHYIAEHYRVRDWEDSGLPYPHAFALSYKIAPESFQPVVRLNLETGEREFAVMRWKMLPFWSKSIKVHYDTINARADKLKYGSTWREPFKKRRCLIPADFFYEWEPKLPEKPRAPTQPWAVTLTDNRLISFGGIWDRWKNPETGDFLESFALVTTEPNELLEPFHNRCPLIIEPKDYARWLSPYVKDDPSTVPVELVRAYPAEGMKAWRVNPLKGDGPELLEPMKPSDESSPILF